MRRIILTVILILSIAAIAFTFLQSNQSPVKKTSILESISSDALVIIEIADLRKLNQTLKNGSVLWPDISQLPGVSLFNNHLNLLDSLYSEEYRVRPDSNFAVTFSLHPNGQQDYAWKLTCPLSENQGSYLLGTSSSLGFTLKEEKVYNEQSIYSLVNTESPLYMAVMNRVAHISPSILCLEKQLRASKDHILSSSSFKDSRNTRSRQGIAYVHIDWARFGSALSTLFPSYSDIHFKEGLASWSTSDLLSESNSLYLNGLIHSPDSIPGGFDDLWKHGSGDIESYLSLIPNNCTYFNYSHSAGQNHPHETLNNSLETGLIQGCLEGNNESYFIQGTKDKEACSAFLNAESESTTILGRPYWAISKHLSPGVQAPDSDSLIWHVVLIDDHLVYSRNKQVVKSIVVSVRSGKTLDEDESFEELRDDVEQSSSLLYYFNLAALSQSMDWNQLAEPLKHMADKTEELQKFQALIIQYEPARDGLTHQNIVLRHNPLSKKERGSIWEMALDVPLKGKMHPFKNHYSGLHEVLVQDTLNRLHLIDNLGKILWTRDLGEAILSDIHQIDIYKNGKVQMVFNTENSVIGLDRKGRDLDGFPIQLSSSASSDLAVLDYDKTKDYRLLIGTTDGTLHNFGVNGESIDGWKHKEAEHAVVGRIKHFSIGSKDYICTIHSDGQLRFLQRNGKVRYTHKQAQLPGYDQSEYHIIAAGKIESTQLLHRNEHNELMKTPVRGSSTLVHEFGMINPFEPGGYVLSDALEFSTFKQNGDQILHFEHSTLKPEVMMLSHGFVGIYDQESGEYFLYDKTGVLAENFPLLANKVLVADLDQDGTLDALLSDPEGLVSFYRLD